jgi:PD-(D/E)XK nuclease superfamily protein
MEGRISPRRQGDLGEFSAIEWLLWRGYSVYVPLGHSPHCDLIATDGPNTWRVQVKTSTVFRLDRWAITVCTRGGNQSWSGLVKRLDPRLIDFLFVLVGDGRRWFVPADEIVGVTKIHLGGPKYSAFEVEPGRPLPVTRTG